jgi:hypothetical protein
MARLAFIPQGIHGALDGAGAAPAVQDVIAAVVERFVAIAGTLANVAHAGRLRFLQ